MGIQNLLNRRRGGDPAVRYPWFKREDVDGFFALFQNNLANFALIAILMAGIGFPSDIIFTRMIPGAAIASRDRTAPVGLALLDENLRYVRINEEVATILERKPEEVIGKTVFEILPEIAESMRQVYRTVLETGQPVRDVEVRGAISTQPDVIRSWLANYYPLKTPEGKTKGVGVVVTEITDRVAIAELGESAIRAADHAMELLAFEDALSLYVSAQAVLEGVAQRGADLVDAAEADTGVSIERLRASGNLVAEVTRWGLEATGLDVEGR